MSYSTPLSAPLQRGSMTPLPWAGPPLRRLFGRRGDQPWRNPGDRRPLMARRLLLLVLVAVCAVLGTNTMVDILPNRGATWLEQSLLVLFAVLFAWISAGFWTAVMGLVLLWRGDRAASMPEAAALPSGPRSRTAIVMPICNEHVATVFGGLRATFESLRETGELAHFDFFILSDTGQPDVRAAEQAAWTALVRDLGLDAADAPTRIHYRWRQLRRRRKAGNVADFCRRWGRAYRYMVVLDADSVMTGECLTALVRRMEAQPDAGIIQTAPRACGHETLHARAQQFGSRVYGPLFTAGMRFWQLGESHYWGHNAILRIEPFMRHCALGAIAGRGSLAGDIMSHDFVEASLMRRAGWKVWIADDLDGSYEQVPPNLIAEVQRDRRWCHGNLQNSRLMFEPGLHPVHRSVFLTGVLAYLSAPLWLGFLLLSTLLFTTHHGETPHYFLEPFQLFPIWPTANLELMLTLFGFTALLLLLPKALALAVVVARREAGQYGGVARLLLGGLLEFVYSMLLAPVRMLFHSQFVFAALTGLRLDWKSPPREDDATPWREAWRRHGLHTLLAVAWVAALVLVGTSFPWWLSPIIGGLLLAAPLSVWSSRRGPGRWLRERRLLLIPEETRLPDVLAAAQRHAEAMARPTGFVDAVLDAPAHAAVLASIAPRPEPSGAAQRAMRSRVERALALGPAGIAADDRLRLLGDARALATLREQVVHGPAHPDWRRSDASAEVRPERRKAPRPLQPAGLPAR